MKFIEFNLDDRLLEACKTVGYEEATPIQDEAIPTIIDGHDVIATAATGTGKTAAFVLPVVDRILEKKAKRALIITPTRELAEQIVEVARSLAQHSRVRVAMIIGGVSSAPQKKALSNGTEIIVCCPGRMLDHIRQRNTSLKDFSTVVLDEADRMLDMGFLPDIKRILKQLPTERQTLLFSATFRDALKGVVKEFLKEPKRINVAVDAPADTIEHSFYPVAAHKKADLLFSFLEKIKHNSILVFTRTKMRANRLHKRLAEKGIRSSALHADKNQQQRKRALDGFRSGKVSVLVATDIAARGIDVDTISHVINYDLPETPTDYIHRIGRTGRAQRTGDAVSFISAHDRVMVRDLERHIGMKVPRKTIEGFEHEYEEVVIPTAKPKKYPGRGPVRVRTRRRR